MDAFTLMAISCLILMGIMAAAAFGRRDSRPQQPAQVVMPDQYAPHSYNTEHDTHDSHRPIVYQQPWANPYGQYPQYPQQYPPQYHVPHRRARQSNWFSMIVLLSIAAFVMGIFSQNLMSKNPADTPGTVKENLQPIPDRHPQRELHDPFVPRHQ